MLVLLLAMAMGKACGDLTATALPQGELSAVGTSLAVTDDYGFVFTAPAQSPVVLPTQSSRLVTPLKYRLSLIRSNILRRNANRLSNNVYTPVATTAGRLVAERISAPLRYWPAVRFYVFELCRLLC